MKLVQMLVRSHWSQSLIADTLTELLIDMLCLCERYKVGEWHKWREGRMVGGEGENKRVRLRYLGSAAYCIRYLVSGFSLSANQI